jgi:hypothetical protein
MWLSSSSGCVDALPGVGDTVSSVDGSDGVDGSGGAEECEAIVPPNPDPDFVPGPKAASLAVFDATRVVPIAVDFPEGEWARFESTWKDPKWSQPGVDDAWEASKSGTWARCSVTIEGETYPDAACRPRGSPEDWAKELKPQMRLKFNEWNKDGRFRGLRALSLEYQRRDAAPIRDFVAMRLMAEAGLPAPRVSHVRLTLDGLDRGVYQAIEPVDHEFLEDHFPDPNGNLYEGGYLKKTNEENPSICDMIAVNDLVALEPMGGTHEAFAAAFTALVDVEQVLRVMAAESVFPTDDNLSNGSTNYFFYARPDARFVAIPWDLDGVLQDDEDTPTDTPLYVYDGPLDASVKLIALVPEIPAWRASFEDALVEIRDGPFAELAGWVEARCAMLAPELATDEAWLAEHDAEALEDECTAIALRAEQRTTFLKSTLGR